MQTYVLMTLTGKEEQVADILNKTVSAGHFYVPYKKMLKKRMDVGWTGVKMSLFPGYVFFETDDIGEVRSHLFDSKISTSYGLVGRDDETGELFPVKEEEMMLIRLLMGEEVSSAVKEGAAVRVVSGSLVGLEALIKKVDLHRKKAWIEVMFLGEPRLIEIGLDLVKAAT